MYADAVDGAVVTPETDADVSPLSRAMLTLGDQWNLLILQHAFLNRTQHFSAWHDVLGLSESVLTDRLRELVAADVLSTTTYRDGARARQAYRLTKSGRDLWPFLVSIWSWETTWVDGRRQWPGMTHATCGASALPELGCQACGRHPVSARDTSAEVVRTVSGGSRRRHHRKSSRSPDGSAPTYHPETLDILGDRWSTLILGSAFLRIRTFATLKAELDIAPSVLTSRLRRFVDLGVFTVVDTPGRRGHDYRLTDKGLAFFPVFAFMNQWSADWLGDDSHTPDLDITHQTCGERFRPALHCGACGEALERTTVRFAELPA